MGKVQTSLLEVVEQVVYACGNGGSRIAWRLEEHVLSAVAAQRSVFELLRLERAERDAIDAVGWLRRSLRC